METLAFFREMLGMVYVSTKDKDELVYNYSFLLREKKKILNKIYNYLMLEEESLFVLEDWQIDLLQLQSDAIIFDVDKKVIQYPNYYTGEELTMIDILKKVSYSPNEITNEEMLMLISFFKNRKLVEDMLNLSGDGLKVNKRILTKIMKLFEDRTSTVNVNIKTYESLCRKLALTRQDIHKLEKKIA